MLLITEHEALAMRPERNVPCRTLEQHALQQLERREERSAK